ncbi:exonuclease SbcCD subunit D [Microbacterium sp. SLBN-146]|uniref:exonuclease SbcCD subunit D n=1 Tax=Microbacterium sp. SLBN-146 TaxID=2768457 RepID=UPI001151AEAE|nr:exonuclease SbcCD subunit D [Microbacterium sp. SLBN-146]TQJ30983.1 exodeoxyribonuclease I subunit D [Microbacterium sp. SLBN-146]
MRILHTSDWHIGRSFHGNSTLDALSTVLGALVRQVRDNDVDVVIVAGDVFDSAVPAAACYTLLSDVLGAIADAGASVVVTSGNHDSAARLGFTSALLREGIHVVTDPLSVGTPVTFTDEHGPVHVYGIPFLEPGMVRHHWPEAELRTHAQTLDHAMGLVRADLGTRGGRSVAVAHCFAAGVSATPLLERDIQQGGLDIVPLSVFDGPDYVALGHIHGRQQLAPHIRYAGAPVHYSFSEGDKPRGSWLVEMDAAGVASVDWLELPVPRRLVTLRGRLDDLLTAAEYDAHVDDWVCAVLTDDTPQLEPMRKLRARFPYAAKIELSPAKRHAGDAVTYAERVAGAETDQELIARFLAHVRAGRGPSERERELIDDVISASRVSELSA